MRCKACNAVMQSEEILWNDEYQEHEPLCRKCRDAVREDDGLEILYEDELYTDSIIDTKDYDYGET